MNLQKLKPTLFSTLFSLVLITLFLGPCSPAPHYIPLPVTVPQDPIALETFVKRKETSEQILPEVKAGILWATADKTKTPYSLVFLHGFSATRRELTPVFETLCSELKMNCYFPRLTGHGSGSEAMGQAQFSDWLNDGLEALEVAQQLGDKIIIAGNSTGASIGLWAEPKFKNVVANIALSPNFRPAAPTSILARGKLGPLFARMIVGPYYEYKPSNELRRKYWTYRYPSHTIATLMEMLKITTDLDYHHPHAPLLVLYSQQDDVVAAPLIEEFFARYPSTNKQIYATAWPHKHVFAGEAANPEGTPWTIEKIKTFLCDNKLICKN